MAKIAVICYRHAKLFKSRRQAMKFYRYYMKKCERDSIYSDLGSEWERCRYLCERLKDGEQATIKNRPDLPAFLLDPIGIVGENGIQDIDAIIKELEKSLEVFGTEKDFWNDDIFWDLIDFWKETA